MYIIKNLKTFINYTGKAGKLQTSIVSFFHLTFVLEGSLTYIIDGQTITLNENDALLVPPGSQRERLPSDKQVHFVILNFKPFSHFDFQNTLILKNSVNQTVRSLLKTYPYTIYNKRKKMRISEIEKSKLDIVLPNISNCIITELLASLEYNTKNNHIQEAIKYINENITLPLTLSDISKELHLTKEYTAKLFKKELNKTVSQFVNEQKLKVAKNMINNDQKNLNEIALSLGYSNYGYFSKIFKNYFGINPIDIKMENKKALEF